MPHFFYKAVDKEGNEHEGVITAVSYKETVAIIKEQELYPVEIYQGVRQSYAQKNLFSWNAFLFKLIRPKVRFKELISFINDLSVLLASGISLVRSLTILERQTLSRRLRRVINELRTDVESGQSLSDSLSKHPEHFSKLFVNMVRSGELGGMLGESLNRLATLYDKSARLTAKIRAALTYPLVVLTFSMFVVVFMVAFIVPKFFIIFGDIDAELPVLTQLLYHLSIVLRTQWGWVVTTIFVLFIVGKILMQIRYVCYVRDAIKLRLPVFGVLTIKVSISHFCRTFGTLLSSGVPILQTLSIAKDAAGNMVFERAIETVKESVKEGESVAAPLMHYASLFPPLVTNMILVGEETGNLHQMLIKVSDRYDEEVDILVTQLTSLLEPLLICGMGILVGFIVIALFLPLVSIVQNLTGV